MIFSVCGVIFSVCGVIVSVRVEVSCLVSCRCTCLRSDLQCLRSDLQCLWSDLQCLWSDLQCLWSDLQCSRSDLQCSCRGIMSRLMQVYVFAEALADGAVKMGMPSALARRIAAQTILVSVCS